MDQEMIDEFYKQAEAKGNPLNLLLYFRSPSKKTVTDIPLSNIPEKDYFNTPIAIVYSGGRGNLVGQALLKCLSSCPIKSFSGVDVQTPDQQLDSSLLTVSKGRWQTKPITNLYLTG